jgi:ATP-dependent RNA helicase DDX31/DBP7
LRKDKGTFHFSKKLYFLLPISLYPFHFFGVDKMGFQVPTRIQAEAIPVAMSGQHMYVLSDTNFYDNLVAVMLFFQIFLFCIGNCRLVKAATGTGKTLAYLAPIVHLLQMREPRAERTDGTFCDYLAAHFSLCYICCISWINSNW